LSRWHRIRVAQGIDDYTAWNELGEAYLQTNKEDRDSKKQEYESGMGFSG